MGKRLFNDSFLIIFLTMIVIQLTGCSIDGLFSNKEFNKGKGTESNPFHVTTVEHLQAINDPENLNRHFIQMADIDASASYEYQNGSGWKQIGSWETPFTGSYNGNGYVIRDLKLHAQRGGPSNGVWGYIKNGRIENVYVDNSVQLSKIRSDDQYQYDSNEQFVESLSSESAEVDLFNKRGVGAMVGINDGGEIINSTFHGIVNDRMGAPAGFVGINTGLVENSHFKGRTHGFSGVGFTSINYGKIIDSSSEIHISGMSAIGFVRINYGEIIRSSAHVDLTGSTGTSGFSSKNIGGRIESSYVTGKISSWYITAGFIFDNSGEVINCYSNVNLSINRDPDNDPYAASLLVYENTEGGMIENSYATGTITANDEGAEIGAVAVKNDGILESVYWDMDSIGNEEAVLFGSPEGTFGLTTGQMTGPAADQNMPAFDWVNVWRTTTGYPALWWED